MGAVAANLSCDRAGAPPGTHKPLPGTSYLVLAVPGLWEPNLSCVSPWVLLWPLMGTICQVLVTNLGALGGSTPPGVLQK